MEEIKLDLNEAGEGAFRIYEKGEEYGLMEVSIAGNELTVYHTEVAPKAEGRGYAKKLLEALVTHARTSHLKIIALCPFVHAQFKRDPAAYADVWKH